MEDTVASLVSLDLCEEVCKRMQVLGFTPEQIQRFTNNEHYKTAVGQQPKVQKVYLTTALSSVLNSGPSVAPSQIRIGLNMATTEVDWLADIGVIVLPFIKANEAMLLP